MIGVAQGKDLCGLYIGQSPGEGTFGNMAGMLVSDKVPLYVYTVLWSLEGKVPLLGTDVKTTKHG